MTRRHWLQRMLMTAWSAVTMAACGRTTRRPEGRAGATADEAAGLSTSELATLVAFGELIVEGRPLSSSERGVVIDHLQEASARSRDQLALYRASARTLDDLAGGSFERLDGSGRREVVARHGLTGAATTSVDHTLQDIPTRLVPDLIRRYWNSEAGWAAVRYSTFPGRCGDLLRYTSPEVTGPEA